MLAAFVSRRDDVVQVRTAVVEQSAIRSLVSTNGKIEPVNNFEAHAPVSTSVRRIYVKEGDSVKKGELLIVLDDADARAQACLLYTSLSASRTSPAEAAPCCSSLFSASRLRCAESRSAPAFTNCASRLNISS